VADVGSCKDCGMIIPYENISIVHVSEDTGLLTCEYCRTRCANCNKCCSDDVVRDIAIRFDYDQWICLECFDDAWKVCDVDLNCTEEVNRFEADYTCANTDCDNPICSTCKSHDSKCFTCNEEETNYESYAGHLEEEREKEINKITNSNESRFVYIDSDKNILHNVTPPSAECDCGFFPEQKNTCKICNQ
jgi:hypothetical protein